MKISPVRIVTAHRRAALLAAVLLACLTPLHIGSAQPPAESPTNASVEQPKEDADEPTADAATTESENAEAEAEAEAESVPQQPTAAEAEPSPPPPPQPQSTERAQGQPDVSPRWQVPASLPDGRKLRAVGIYQSQMDVLIPSHYYPVSVEQFVEAIKRLGDRATDNQTSRLKTAEYWIDIDGDTLVSNRSVIDIESDRGIEVRRSLGKVNLAIEQPYSRGSSSVTQILPRLESEPDGNLVAVFRGDDKSPAGIEFKWQLRGRPLGNGHEFNLRLPPTPQTRIVLSAPNDIMVEAVDGVLHQRPGPPPDASNLADDRSWYEIDAGGLDQVRLRTEKIGPTPDGESFVVRQSSMQYRADPGGLTWTCRMLVQPPADRPFPALLVQGTTLTSAKVNATEVALTRKTTEGQTHWQLEVPRGVVDPQAVLANVVLTGHSIWDQPQGWCDLAMPQWQGDRVVQASTFDQVELAVVDPLQLITWRLPQSWHPSSPQPREDGTSIFTAVGPPVPLLDDSSDADDAGKAWSRVRFVPHSFISRSQTDLRLELSGGSLTAASRITLQVDPRRIEPLAMRVQPGWSIESITFTASGRVIETPAISERTRVINLWPEAEDVAGTEIEIELAGTRLMPGNTGAITIPSTWFARFEQARGETVAAMLRPPNLNWSGQAAMQRLPQPPTLTEQQSEFFAATDEDTLWFQPETGRTPPVTLQTPTVSYNAESLFQVIREGGDIIERLVIEVDSQSQTLQELAVQTGPSLGRPEFAWSISGIGDAPATSVPASDVTVGQGNNDGIYTMDVSDKILRGRRLIGRRRYPLQPQIAMQLPSVPGATSQRSEVHLGPGLLLRTKSRAVQQVPHVGDEVFAGNNSATITTDTANTGAQQTRRRATRLRYDAVEQPSITLQSSNENPDVTMVWQERIRVIASSRGTDLIEATYHVSPSVPFQVDYGLDLQLTSIHRDGTAVDLSSIKQRPIVLESHSHSEIIRIRWTRSKYQSGWIRHCQIPRISASGTVLRSQYQLVPATDSFAPAALLQGRAATTGGTSIVESRPGEIAILVRRNIALALGWLVAMLVFAAAWYAAERWPLLIVVAVAVLSTVVFLWWPWRLAVIGWFIVPILAAGMLATSRFWHQRAGESSLAETYIGRGEESPSSLKELLSDFSVDSVARFLLWLWIVSVPIVAAVAQGPSATNKSAASQVINVLVPVTKDGKPSSEMIYISRKLRSELFPATATRKPQDARFQQATYDVRLDAEVNSDDPSSAVTVEAEYVIHLSKQQRGPSLVRLPLPAASVRRIERIDDKSRLIQFVPDESGEVIASLPEGDFFRIRATLIPAISQSDQRTKLFLPIPSVASTRLTVESETNIESLRVGGAGGALLRETDLRRWVEELGPVDSLEIDFRTTNESSDSAAPLGRRYWVRANSRQVSIDCEVDPPHAVAAGETFQFIIRDARIPRITACGWRLERSEQYSPTRRLMTVTSRRDAPGPVRLLWTEPVTLSDAEPEEALSIRIPEVIAAALGENAPAWIAFHSEPAIRFLPLSRESTEPLSVDHFLAAWSGYRGGIDLAMVALDEMPSPVIEHRHTQPPVAQQQHDLRVAPDRLELHYSATILPNDPDSQRYALRFPHPLRLERVIVNDLVLDQQPVRFPRHQELLLGHFSGEQPITVEVVATQSLGGARNRRFTPPAMQLSPMAPSTGTYVISRAPEVRLRELEPSAGSRSQLTPATESDLLVGGWVPYSMWVTSSSDDPDHADTPGGSYEVHPRPIQFDTRQLIALQRQSGQWAMETTIDFRSARAADFGVPDFIDVEVPTAWCDSLAVSPAGSLLDKRDATDASRQVLRIRCSSTNNPRPTIVLSGRLQNSATGRVNVPVVRVLGPGARQIHVNLPAELDDEPIQWRTSAVEAVQLPEFWRESVAGEPRSTYLVASPSWSIELAPLPEDDAGAIAVAADAQVFPREDGALVLCHWDLYPGSLENVRVRLPEGSQCVGAWSAGRAVVADTLVSEDESKREILSVPLSLSRLSQPIEVLLRVPANVAREAQYLPDLMDVSVTQKWLVNYATASAGNTEEAVDDDVREDRALAMAQGVVEAIAAVNRVTQRPRDEVAAWLQLWVARYRMIARSVNRSIELQDIPAGFAIAEAGDEAPQVEAGGRSLPRHLRWKQLDAELAYHIGRLLPAESSVSETLTGSSGESEAETETLALKRNAGADFFLFDVADYQGFVPQRVTPLSATVRPEPIQPVSPDDQGLRLFIINLLTLLLISGLLISLRPLRRYFIPVVVHPAFWLALIGIFGFAVAPISVASAVLLVALALPAFPTAHKTAAATPSRVRESRTK